MSQQITTAYDPTLYHEHPLTAILYAQNSGFTVAGEGEQATASRDDMPESLFTLTKIEDAGDKRIPRWCWVRTN